MSLYDNMNARKKNKTSRSKAAENGETFVKSYACRMGQQGIEPMDNKKA